MYSAKPLARLLKVTLLLTAILLSSSLLLAHQGEAANPSNGTITQSSPSLTWQGAFYAAGVNADPSACPPPSIDTMNLVCDHFFLTISLASDFWTTHTGTVTITITWGSGSNDFDLYIYRQSDGAQVASSTLGGGETQEQVVLQ